MSHGEPLSRPHDRHRSRAAGSVVARGRAVVRLFALAALFLVAAGCDRDPLAPAASAPPAAPARTHVTLELLATIAPVRPTLLAATPAGRVYFVQADPADADAPATVFRIDAAGTVEPTELRTGAVWRAMGLNLNGGRFESLVARSGGEVWFVCRGPAGAPPRAQLVIGRFDPDAGLVRVPAEADDVVRAAGDLGFTAGPDLFVSLTASASDGQLCVFLRDGARWGVGELAYDGAADAASRPSVTFRPVIAQVRNENNTDDVSLADPRWRMAAVGYDLWVTDPRSTAVYRISGRDRRMRRVIDLPPMAGAVCPPVAVPPARVAPPPAAPGDATPPKQVAWCALLPVLDRAAAGVPMRGDDATFANRAPALPALLRLEPAGRTTTYDRTKLVASPGAASVDSLRLTAATPVMADGSVVFYDAASGQLLRARPPTAGW
jgi:hypothetical protein